MPILALLGHRVGQRGRPTIQMAIIAHCCGNGEGVGVCSGLPHLTIPSMHPRF